MVKKLFNQSLDTHRLKGVSKNKNGKKTIKK